MRRLRMEYHAMTRRSMKYVMRRMDDLPYVKQSAIQASRVSLRAKRVRSTASSDAPDCFSHCAMVSSFAGNVAFAQTLSAGYAQSSVRQGLPLSLFSHRSAGLMN